MGTSLDGGFAMPWVGKSAAMGDTLSTFGIGAHGDFTGVGGAGGLATNVGFSGAPLRTRPFPEPSTPGLIIGEAIEAGIFGFSGMPFSFVIGFGA